MKNFTKDFLMRFDSFDNRFSQFRNTITISVVDKIYNYIAFIHVDLLAKNLEPQLKFDGSETCLKGKR